MPKKKVGYKQLNMFGKPFVDPKPAPAPKARVIPSVFEGHEVRVRMIGGKPMWVAHDVCRAIGIVQPSSAVRRLPEDERATVLNTHSSGGKHFGAQSLVLVNQAGLFRLIFMSRKAEAERFKDWVFKEVLPAIFETGSYSVDAPNKVAATARRLRCSAATAKVRCEQASTNSAIHGRLHSQSAKREHYREVHNAVYRGMTGGFVAKDLRRVMGVTDSPLNHMEAVALSMNLHPKVLAERFIRDNDVPLRDQAAVYERFAAEVRVESLAKFGPGHELGYTDDPRRGLVLDVVHRQLPRRPA